MMRMWIRLGFALLGIVGAAIAITAIVVALPQPAVGGTCGPGQSSEAPIVALFNPGSIGAGAEPPASDATGRVQWLAFVGECQSSTDGRVLAGFGILVLSVGVALLGPALLLHNGRFEGGDGSGSAGGGSPSAWPDNDAPVWEDEEVGGPDRNHPGGAGPSSWESGVPAPWGTGTPPAWHPDHVVTAPAPPPGGSP